MDCTNVGLKEIPDVPRRVRMMVVQLNMDSNNLEDLHTLDTSEWPSLTNVTIHGNDIKLCIKFKNIDVEPDCKLEKSDRKLDVATIKNNNILSIVIPVCFLCATLAGVLLVWKTTKKSSIGSNDLEVAADYSEIKAENDDDTGNVGAEAELELIESEEPEKKSVGKKKKKESSKEPTRRSQSKLKF